MAPSALSGGGFWDGSWNTSWNSSWNSSWNNGSSNSSSENWSTWRRDATSTTPGADPADAADGQVELTPLTSQPDMAWSPAWGPSWAPSWGPWSPAWGWEPWAPWSAWSHNGSRGAGAASPTRGPDPSPGLSDLPDGDLEYLEHLDREGWEQLVATVATAIVLGLLILATVIGNVFVIAAILLERHLQHVANYLILSLAVADLLVACLVMPLGAVYEVRRQWLLGPELCDMWTASDVLCCTASILHLVAIALDRYWAVTNVDYIHRRTGRRVGVMISLVWCAAFLVCVAPVLGWKDPEWPARLARRQCLVSQDVAYQVFATASSFWLPLLAILLLYWRIFQAARKRIRRRAQMQALQAQTRRDRREQRALAGLVGAAVVSAIGRPLPTVCLSETTTTTTTTAFTNTTASSANSSPERTACPASLACEDGAAERLELGSAGPGAGGVAAERSRRWERRERRERKAAKTLAVITGAFVLCWLPFFLLAVLQPACRRCHFNRHLVSLFLWLGYFNSTLNPIIYTIFSPDFRNAFKRLLCGRRNQLRRRPAQPPRRAARQHERPETPPASHAAVLD